MKKFILPGMVMISLIIAVCFGGYSMLATSGAEGTLNAQAQQIREIEQELNEIEKAKDEEINVKAVLNTAAKLGTEVAAYQTEFCKMSISTDDDDVDALSMKADLMRSAFSVKDGGATVPWYNGEDYTWNFETTYSFSGKTVPVLWLCRERSGDVLAYCTATYNADDETFSNVEWATLSRNGREQASTVDLPDNISRDDIWKALVGKMDDYLPTPTPSIDPYATLDPSATPGATYEPGTAHGDVYGDDDASSDAENLDHGTPQRPPSEALLDRRGETLSSEEASQQ